MGVAALSLSLSFAPQTHFFSSSSFALLLPIYSLEKATPFPVRPSFAHPPPWHCGPHTCPERESGGRGVRVAPRAWRVKRNKISASAVRPSPLDGQGVSHPLKSIWDTPQKFFSLFLVCIYSLVVVVKMLYTNALADRCVPVLVAIALSFSP